jgi:hypothetical protein
MKEEIKKLQENIVPATDQNKGSFFPRDDVTGNGLKILFVGNSITKHAPKADIGWFGDWGMAATSLENDYVHQTMSKIREVRPGSGFAMLQVAGYEREFYTLHPSEIYEAAREYRPDVVIMFFGANVNKEYDTTENPPRTFGEAYEELRNWIDNWKTLFIHSQGFYIRPVLDNEKKNVAEKYGDIFVNIEDIRNREDTHGKFNHPNDLGMALIAERVFSVLSEKLKGEFL